jgi:signal transduction histidine kinase
MHQVGQDRSLIRQIGHAFWDQLLHWRWWFFGSVSACVIIWRMVLHRSQGNETLDETSAIALLSYGLILPLLGGALLSLVNTRSQLKRVIHRQNLEHVLSEEVANARDWDELIVVLLQFMRLVFPTIGATLAVRNPTTEKYELAETWSSEGKSWPDPDPDPFEEACSIRMALDYRESVFVPCRCIDTGDSKEWIKVWCLPLLHASGPIGILHLFFHKSESLSEHQIDLLTDIVPEIALALERALLERSVVDQVAATQAAQEHFARYLHDTLGHNLAYLRLKLDQFSRPGALRDGHAASREMEKMRDIAGQAYDQVRYKLTDLRENLSLELPDAFRKTALVIGKRADFHVHFRNNGTTRSLDAGMRRQLLYILREILRNVEKHAGARRLNLTLTWEDQRLNVIVADNGKGFDLETVRNQEGHYGLRIIEECIAELEGGLAIHSTPGEGTKVVFHVPLRNIQVDPYEEMRIR